MSPPPLPSSRLAFGIDVAADKFDIAFGRYDHRGAFSLGAAPKTFANTAAGIEACIKWCHRCLRPYGDRDALLTEAQVVVEATGVYHEAIVARFHAAGLRVCVAQAKAVRHFRLSLGRHSKTDRQDARALAEFACSRRLEAWAPGSAHLLAIRALLRHRHGFITERTAILSRRHAYERSTVENPVLTAAIDRQLEQLDALVKDLEAEARRLYRADADLRSKLDPIIAAVPGIGWLTALTIVAETNAFAGITSGKQLASYAGLDVIDNQSGAYAGRSRISKRGNARLRECLYMGALVHRRRATRSPMSAMARRIAARNPQASKKATVAVMRKLLLLVRTLYLSGEGYRVEEASAEIDATAEMEASAANASVEPESGSPDTRPGLREVVEGEPDSPEALKSEKLPEIACTATQ